MSPTVVASATRGQSSKVVPHTLNLTPKLQEVSASVNVW